MQKQNPLLRIWGWGKDEHGSLIIAIIGAFVGVALGMLPYFAAAQVIIKMLAGEKNWLYTCHCSELGLRGTPPAHCFTTWRYPYPIRRHSPS